MFLFVCVFFIGGSVFSSSLTTLLCRSSLASPSSLHQLQLDMLLLLPPAVSGWPKLLVESFSPLPGDISGGQEANDSWIYCWRLNLPGQLLGQPWEYYVTHWKLQPRFGRDKVLNLFLGNLLDSLQHRRSSSTHFNDAQALKARVFLLFNQCFKRGFLEPQLQFNHFASCGNKLFLAGNEKKT